jgi:hypothetical protein
MSGVAKKIKGTYQKIFCSCESPGSLIASTI